MRHPLHAEDGDIAVEIGLAGLDRVGLQALQRHQVLSDRNRVRQERVGVHRHQGLVRRVRPCTKPDGVTRLGLDHGLCWLRRRHGTFASSGRPCAAASTMRATSSAVEAPRSRAYRLRTSRYRSVFERGFNSPMTRAWRMMD